MGLGLPGADVSRVLRQTVPVEAKYRIGVGATVAAAFEHARLRGGRATANMGADTARSAYTGTIRDAGMAWAWVPTASACPFCLLMAGRGAVYRSEDTAKGHAGYYHPWDRCRTVCVPKGCQAPLWVTTSTATPVRSSSAPTRRTTPPNAGPANPRWTPTYAATGPKCRTADAADDRAPP